MTCFVVLEPHADDAFLSLGGHIEQWVKYGHPVRIVTVCSATRKRARDAEDYARAVGASWVGLGYDEGLSEFTMTRFDLTGGVLIVPLGIQNHDHIVIANAFPRRICRYLDTPYHIVQKNGPEICSALEGRQVYSFLKPPARKWRHIPLFKDQAKFFHYNTSEKLQQCVELIVRG
jgi:hypothetical protein